MANPTTADIATAFFLSRSWKPTGSKLSFDGHGWFTNYTGTAPMVKSEDVIYIELDKWLMLMNEYRSLAGSSATDDIICCLKALCFSE